MIQKEKIIVLRTFKHGEADLIVHGLNPLGARMNFFARGGLKSRKRFAGGVLEPTHYIDISYKVSASNESDPLHSLLEAQIIREFPGLRTDYARLDAALYFLKLVHKLGQQGVVDSPDLFNLLGNALTAAETSGDLEKLKTHFELKLLSAQGVLPADSPFQSWLQTTLAKHESVICESGTRRWVQEQVYSHLHQYIGSIT
ncbi:MAG: DNA repair protein RecO [Bdellovibrionales bacterium]